jgi:cyclopropane fatty-acyl-phospholipid synthase-like methyltransferase
MTKKKLYDGNTREKWIEELEKDNTWNLRHLYACFAAFGTPSSLLDVGCGLGELVRISERMQIEAWGCDQLVDDSYEPEGSFFHCDLRQPFSLAEHTKVSVVDWVICLETGEHMPDEFINVFCDTLCNHVRRDAHSMLIFTAAHPGQGGTEHVSTRPATFWRDMFYERGLNYQPERTHKLLIHWLNLGSPKFWLSSNLQIFSK